MFVVFGIVILVVSFIIAFASLLFEERKGSSDFELEPEGPDKEPHAKTQETKKVKDLEELISQEREAQKRQLEKAVRKASDVAESSQKPFLFERVNKADNLEIKKGQDVQHKEVKVEKDDFQGSINLRDLPKKS